MGGKQSKNETFSSKFSEQELNKFIPAVGLSSRTIYDTGQDAIPGTLDAISFPIEQFNDNEQYGDLGYNILGGDDLIPSCGMIVVGILILVFLIYYLVYYSNCSRNTHNHRHPNYRHSNTHYYV